MTFYTVAIFVTGIAVRFIAQDPVRIGFLGGALLIFIGSVLGYEAFPFQGQQPIELVRLLFVSGKYGVFVMMGCAWLMIGVGVLIRNHLANGTSFHRDVMAVALGMALLGLSDGRVVGWRTLGDLGSGYIAPPQLWYLAMVGGMMLSTLVALDRYPVPVLGFMLERIGRYPLSIYVAHSFVLPSVALIRSAAPSLPDLVVTVGCLLIFLAFCSYKVWTSTRTDQVLRLRNRSGGRRTSARP